MHNLNNEINTISNKVQQELLNANSIISDPKSDINKISTVRENAVKLMQEAYELKKQATTANFDLVDKLIIDANCLNYKVSWFVNKSKNDQEANNKLLKDIINNKNISDKNLYLFLIDKQIKPNGGWFFYKAKSTPLSDFFTQTRNLHVEAFYKKYTELRLMELLKLWKENFKSQNSVENEHILIELITNKNVSEEELYNFLALNNVKKDGGWFIYKGSATHLIGLFKTHRNQEVKDFYTKMESITLPSTSAAPISVTPVSPASSATGTLSWSSIGEPIQEVIDKHSSQPFPLLKDVAITLAGTTHKWVELSPEEKYKALQEHSLPHNKHKTKGLEHFGNKKQWEDHLNYRLLMGSHDLGTGQPNIYLERDPRKDHGSDHAVRVSLFSTAFATLYNKYYNGMPLSATEMSVIPIIGAAHDCGRQTEGVDIDDHASANICAQILQKQGLPPKIVKGGQLAIIEKDDQNLQSKDLMTKSLQCADSMEYARLGAFDPSYLDICKEFKTYPAALKPTYSYSEFEAELSVLIKEMKAFITETSSAASRAEFSQPGKNYYNEMLKKIDAGIYPKLHALYSQVGSISPAKGDAASPVPALLKETQELFPGMLSEIKFIEKFTNSTTGAEKVQDQAGNIYAKKTIGKIKPEHLRAEYHTNKAYKVLGIGVPEVALYHSTSMMKIKDGEESHVVGEDKPVMLSKFVPGKTQDLEDYFKALGLDTRALTFDGKGVDVPDQWKKDNMAAIDEVRKIVRQGFVADCLMANWDVAGLNFDNIKYDQEAKKVWRIDNGSGLDYRAQGELKNPKFFTPEIQEFNTLRNPAINPNTAFLYESLTDQEILTQINQILPLRTKFLACIPNRLKDIMGKRFDYLSVYRQQLMKKALGA